MGHSPDFERAKGYVLLDVLLGLFLFFLGFGVLFELTIEALSQTSQAVSLLEGANLAQETMDKLSSRAWRENIACGDCLPGRVIARSNDKFSWRIYSEWQEAPYLLKVSVEVNWTERGIPYSYKLESLYAVE